MKHKQEVPRKFAITVVTIMAIVILFAIFQPRAKAQGILRKVETGKMYIKRIQKEKSWETYQANRLKSAKERAKVDRDQQLYRRQEEKLQAKIRRIEG